MVEPLPNPTPVTPKPLRAMLPVLGGLGPDHRCEPAGRPAARPGAGPAHQRAGRAPNRRLRAVPAGDHAQRALAGPIRHPVRLSLTNTALLSATADLGSGWVRLGPISWRRLQPTGAAIRWDLLASFERELLLVKQHGITPEVIIYDSSAWADQQAVCHLVRRDPQR